MILRPEQIKLLRMGRPTIPANLGGSSESDASTRTTNNTSTAISTVDRRAVASENADAITGDNNSITRIQTDFGSVGRALDAVTQTGARAIDLGQFAVGGAVDVLKQQTAGNLTSIAQIIDLAKNYGANAMTNSKDVMGLATSTAQIAADAYKNQADSASGNRTVILVGLAVVGTVAAAIAWKH
jgi:hypothetical protein